MMAPSSVIVLDSDEETEPTSKRKKRVDPTNVNKRQKLSHNPSTIKKHKPLIVALDSRLLLANKSEPKNPEEQPKSPAISSTVSQVHSHGESNVSLSLPGDTTNGILDGTLKRLLDSSLLQDQSLMRMLDKMSPEVFLNSTSVLNESNINLSQLDVSQLLNASLLDQTFSLASEKANISHLDSLLSSVEAQPSGMQAQMTSRSEVVLPEQDSEILMPNQKSLISVPDPPCLETVPHLIPPNIVPPMPLLAPPFYSTVVNQMLGSQLLGNLNLLAQLHLQSLLASTLHASSHMASLSNYQQHAGFQNPSQRGDGCSFEKDCPMDGSTNIISIEPLPIESPGYDVGGGGGSVDGDLGTFSRSFVSIAPTAEETSNDETTNDKTDGLPISRTESLVVCSEGGFEVRGVRDVCRSIDNNGEDEHVEKLYVDGNKVDDVDDRSIRVDVDQIANTNNIPVKSGIIEDIANPSVNGVSSFRENITDENGRVNNVEEIDNAGENIDNVESVINNVDIIDNLVATTEAIDNVAQPLNPNVDNTSQNQIDDDPTDPSSGRSIVDDDNDPEEETDANNDADACLHGDGSSDDDGGGHDNDEKGKNDGDSPATELAEEDNLRPGVFEDSSLADEVSKFSDGDSTSSVSTENDSGLCSESHKKSDDVESKREDSIKTNLCKTIEPPASKSSETFDSEIPVDIIQPTDEFLTEKFIECDEVSTRLDFLNKVRLPFKVKPEIIKKESICGEDDDGYCDIVSVKEDVKLDISRVKKEVKSEPQDVENRATNHDILVQPKQEELKIKKKPAIKHELSDQGPSEEALELSTGKSAHLTEEDENVSTPTPSKKEVAAPSRRVSIPLSVLQDLDISSFSASLNVESKSVPCYNCRQNVTQFAKCSSAHNCCLLCLFDKIKIWVVSNSKDVFACEHPDCTSFYKIAELRQVLPEMIVEIMEEKLEREYVASTNVFLKKVNSNLMPVAPLKLGTDDWWPQYDHWDQMDHNKPYCLVDVNKSSKEFEKVSKLFHKTMTSPRAKVIAIRKLLNPTLWQYYCMRKEQSMRHLSHVKHQLERMLFHGIKRKFLDVVCLENVDWRKCGISHGILFGDGTYFARDASYAHQYTDKYLPAPSRRECDVDEALNRCLEEKENVDSTVDPIKAYDNVKRLMSQRLWEILDDRTTQKDSSLHSRFMLVARVFVGRYAVGRMNMRKPPPVDPTDPYGPCYDSLVNYADRPTLFVMSDVNQHYPEYVIEYTNQPREKTSSSTTFSTDSFWFN